MASFGFDTAAAVAAFAIDADRQTLELPAMDANGRKFAKAVVDGYPELSCKTYGLGGDRCLHVFKADVSGSPVQKGVTVKNTFIDDWIAGGGEADQEAAAFRSLPVHLPQPAAAEGEPQQQAAPALPTMSKSAQKTREGNPSLSPPRGKLGKQLDLSPIGESETKWPKDHSGERQLPTLLSGCQVRNTFIHIDIDAGAGIDDESEHANDRSIQSMPEGVFRQCLEEEQAARRQKAAAAPTKAPATLVPATAEKQTFVKGMMVVIHGLSKLPAFNGKSGIVESYDAQTERYSVALTSPVPGCPRRAKVKADNLKSQASFLAVSPPAALDDNCYDPSAMPEIPPTPQWLEDCTDLRYAMGGMAGMA